MGYLYSVTGATITVLQTNHAASDVLNLLCNDDNSKKERAAVMLLFSVE